MKLAAWIKLSEKESGSAWSTVYSQFGFNPSVEPRNFPGFKEPAPSITYSISDVYGEEAHYILLNNDLHEITLSIFCQIVPVNDFIYALDWHHTCYKFFPHRDFEERQTLDWPIPILPNGDYYIFLDQNFEFGILGHPWEQTMCVFGDRLLDAMASTTPKLFQNPIRKNLITTP